MSSYTSTDQKAFMSSLLRARDRPQTIAVALWASRWAILQWVFVIAVFAIFYAYVFGPTYTSSVVALGVGLLLGLLLQLRQATRTWPWLAQVIDWSKVEREVSGRSADAP